MRLKDVSLRVVRVRVVRLRDVRLICGRIHELEIAVTQEWLLFHFRRVKSCRAPDPTPK
jgi:hypothetical protein